MVSRIYGYGGSTSFPLFHSFADMYGPPSPYSSIRHLKWGIKMKEKAGQKVLGIDPGISGAFVITDGERYLRSYPMPISIMGKEKRILYNAVFDLLGEVIRREGQTCLHVFLERAMPIAMGSKAAFNYGRGFETVVIAIEQHRQALTLIEPAKWTKEMHEGISADLKPKAKSLIAVQRLFPQLVGSLPQKMKGGLHDGPIDALLIAAYGLRKLRGMGLDTPQGQKRSGGHPGAPLNSASIQVDSSSIEDPDEVDDFY